MSKLWSSDNPRLRRVRTSDMHRCWTLTLTGHLWLHGIMSFSHIIIGVGVSKIFLHQITLLKEIKWNEKRELWYLTKGEVIITIHFKHAFWVWLKLLFANCDFVTLCFVRTKGLCRVNFCLPRTACAFSFPLYPKICLTNGLDGLLQRLLLSSLAHARAPCALYQNILCLNFTLQTCLRL